MVLSCQMISKAFGTDEILKKVNFHVNAGDRLAIVGINGSGKTTLLRIIMGELPADEGQVILSKGTSIGYLPQNPNIFGNRSIWEELLSTKEKVISMEQRLLFMEKEMNRCSGQELEGLLEEYHALQEAFQKEDGLTYKSEITGVLRGLGFLPEEFSKKMETLSGGQRTRVCLGKLLVTKPDVILLDEPTNHLDIGSIRWLETYLSNYKGTVLIVSHDRYFLDRIADHVMELDRGNAVCYQGNYTAYAQKRAMEREALRRQYENQQRELRHQEEVIAKLKSFNREKSIKRAESREKALGKIERLDKPTEENTDIKIVLEPQIQSGKDVLMVEGISKTYGSQTLFSDLSFQIQRGERVALIGDNGTGKTPILKIIDGVVDPDGGSIRLGSQVHVGYYDQEHQILHGEKNLMEEIADDFPDLTQTKIRNVLAAFLFTGDEVFKRISELSGGERGRVSLAKLMLSKANFLILDEPTNHLDITSKEILEEALASYQGTVLFVSHDRYFINKVCTRILNLEATGLTGYLGNYDYFLEKALPKQEAVSDKAPVSEGKLDWKSQKEQEAKKRKQANELKKAEDAIAAAEEKIASLESAFENPAISSNAFELGKLQKSYEEEKEKLEELYLAWEELAEEA